MLVASPRPYVCLRCLLRLRRNFSSTRSRSEVKQSSGRVPYPSSSGCARLTRRRLISISGDDSPRFLQGLITANVAPPSNSSQSPFYSTFLNAQGRLLYDVFVFPLDGPCPAVRNGDNGWPDILGYNVDEKPGYLLDVDGASAESLLGHLKRHKLRAKINLRLLAKEDAEIWETWHDNSEQETRERDEMLSDGQILLATDARAVSSSLVPFGYRHIVPRSQIGKQHYFKSLHPHDQESYDIRRYLYGVPEGQVELQRDAALPHQSNIDIMGGIDFRKGCYVGQELTIRTQHTGVVRRRILPLQLYDLHGTEPQELVYDPAWPDMSIPTGASVAKLDAKGRSTGKWMGGIGNIGLGLCRLEVMTDVAVSAEGTSWKRGDQFKITWEAEGEEARDGIGVKAFVPPWMRSRLPAVKPARRVE